MVALRALFAGGWLGKGAAWSFEFVTGRTFGSAVESLMAVATSLGLLAILLEGMLGDRVPILKPYLGALAKLAALVPKALLAAARATFLAVEGRPLPEPKKPKSGARGEKR